MRRRCGPRPERHPCHESKEQHHTSSQLDYLTPDHNEGSFLCR